MDVVIWIWLVAGGVSALLLCWLSFWLHRLHRYVPSQEEAAADEPGESKAPRVIRCSCGAVQFPQATFCHWCGKGIDAHLSLVQIKRKLVQLRSKMNKEMEPLHSRIAELAPEDFRQLSYPSLSEEYRYLNFTIQENKNLPKGHTRAYGLSGKLYVA